MIPTARVRSLFIAVAAAVLVAGCTGASSAPSTSVNGTNSSISPTAQPTVGGTPPSSVPPAAAGTWTATGTLITARSEATATLLMDGRVLLVGGTADSENLMLATAELYDPATGHWLATGSMRWPRAQHTATLLADGRVLVAGGLCNGQTMKSACPAGGDLDGAIADAELYDPATGTWKQTGPMTTSRFLHTATLLKNGKVLVVGAEHAPDSILDSAELYDPKTGTWTATGSMNQARTQNVAALLPDGAVLVAGGIGPVSSADPTKHDLLASAELYDPSVGTWSQTGSLITKRAYGGTATALADGTVMFVGGDGPGDPQLASVEIYHPHTGVWSETGSLAHARDLLTSTLLADGKVLVAGGFVGSDAAGFTNVAPAELWDPGTGTWANAGDLPSPRVLTIAILLGTGDVLIAGGGSDTGEALASSELYTP